LFSEKLLAYLAVAWAFIAGLSVSLCIAIFGYYTELLETIDTARVTVIRQSLLMEQLEGEIRYQRDLLDAMSIELERKNRPPDLRQKHDDLRAKETKHERQAYNSVGF